MQEIVLSEVEALIREGLLSKGLLDENGETFRAQVYIADDNAIDNALSPYDWYKAFVVTGAEQNNLPPDYIERIRNVHASIDTSEQRRQRQFAILNGE